MAGKVGRARSQRSWKPDSARKFSVRHRMRSHSQALSNEINQKHILAKSSVRVKNDLQKGDSRGLNVWPVLII